MRSRNRTYRRIADSLHGKSKPRRIARWVWWGPQLRMRLLTGHASKSKTRQGRQWRLFWRLKKIGR